MNRAVEERVRRRARNRCEYCHMPESADTFAFHIDHVIARQHRGRTSLSNLALSCSFCNTHKGPNLAGIDPVTRSIVPLFNPRRDIWTQHFRWSGARLIGLTPSGRASIVVLSINASVNLALRRSLMAEGLFEDDGE